MHGDKHVLLCVPGPKAVSQLRVGLIKKDGELTDRGILEDDQEARIVDPLDLKPSTYAVPL